MRALVLCSVVACSSQPASPPQTPPTAPGPTSLAAVDANSSIDTASASVPPDAAASTGPIDVTFVGDLMFGGYFDNHYDPQYPERHDPLVEVDRLLASDLAIGNLETTIARTLPNRGGPHDGVGHKRFVTLPERVAVLARHHLRHVTLSNNHQLDNDAAGLTDTVAILDELGIAYLGAARSEPPTVRIETIAAAGWRIGAIAATTRLNRSVPKGANVPYVLDRDLVATLRPLVERARADHDLVLVLLHWGVEYQDRPETFQVNAAHALIDAGADAIIGHHPHVLQPIERYRDGVIAYSLGNFVFPNGKERIRDTGVLRLRFAAPPSRGARACAAAIRFHPAIQVRQPITHPVIPTPAQRDMIAKRWFALSAARPFSTTWRSDGDDFVVDTSCPAR